jgi:hypothetical protein
LDAGTRGQAVVSAVWLQLNFEVACDGIYPPKASVVPSGFIVWAWISKANKQLNHAQIIRERCGVSYLKAHKQNGPPKWAVQSKRSKKDYFFFLLSPAAAAAS